jgi:hypothetical protein
MSPRLLSVQATDARSFAIPRFNAKTEPAATQLSLACSAQRSSSYRPCYFQHPAFQTPAFVKQRQSVAKTQ